LQNTVQDTGKLTDTTRTYTRDPKMLRY